VNDRAVLYHSTGDRQWLADAQPDAMGMKRIDVVWGSGPSDVYVGGGSKGSGGTRVLHGTRY
jgi:hypothetical protein